MPNPFAEWKFLLTSALDPVEEVFVVANDLTARFVAELAAALEGTGARLVPINASEEFPYDVWVQDAVEIGRRVRRAPSAWEQEPAILTGLRALHDPLSRWTEPLDRRVREYFEAQDVTVIVAGEPRHNTRWIDWFGNLEVSPPVRDARGREFPHGRVLTGRQKELTLHPGVMEVLEQQGIQTPGLVLDVSWLLIGHVDELVHFVPAHDAPGFRALIPSPSLARELLERSAQKDPTALALIGTERETTAAQLLEEIAFSEENRAIEAALIETRAQLREGLGLDDAHILGLPALYKDGGPAFPSPVNGLTCNGTAILPAPHGPVVEGQDLFAANLRRQLEPLGVRVRFVNDWQPYHVRGGEIHCGTNTLRRINLPLTS